jgi:hypothetical protein
MIREMPTKIRRLKNADRVEQFFFMYFEDHDMAQWLRLELKWIAFFGARFVLKPRTKGFRY